MNIQIISGNITKSTCDAIVNAANPKMLGGGGVDGAIHKAAGPRLLEECRKVKSVNGIRCPFGEARITLAGNLNANFVIHTVGPIYRNEQDPASTLRAAYRNSCELAVENNCKSISFPALSCGAYGYPHKEAAKIAIDTCREFPQLEISFYIFDKALLNVFNEANNGT
jgi:O-acetyl-ADP-ribose deacetylase